MNIEKILSVAVRGGASDIILKIGALPRFRYYGDIIDLTDGVPVTTEMMHDWISKLVPKRLWPQLTEVADLDFSYTSEKGFRFRANLFRQRDSFSLVMRVINNHIRTMEELQLPKVMQNIPKEHRGLVLVTGATGSGKSTTLASIIEKINLSRHSHILTIEDPIEFIFKEKKSTISQREIGVDTLSFADALRSALRQNPDIILVGELRDKETTETALMAAETGHLVLSTLHTMDAVETVTRLLTYFPPHQHASIRSLLAQTLRYVISQRLIPKKDEKGQVPALEILMNNEAVREHISQGEDASILRDFIRNGHQNYGMQSFDQSLFDLFERGIISRKTALEYASNPKDLELAMSGFASSI
jgi:twitching motility protein PilT